MVWKKVGKTMRNVQILASGKWKFLKGKWKSHRKLPSQSRASKPKTYKRRSSTMGRRKSRRGGGGFGLGKLQRTAESAIGVIAFASPGLQRGKAVWDNEHDMIRAFTEGAGVYAGLLNGQFRWDIAMNSWIPFLAFTGLRGLAHKAAGIIRKL